MKKITFIMLALVAFVATSCSSGYSEEKCKELCAKIEKGETLSQDDYAECIDQCDAILDECKSKLESIQSKIDGKDENSAKLYDEFLQETGTMRGYLSTLGHALNGADLDSDNKARIEGLKTKDKEVSNLRSSVRKKSRWGNE